MAKDWQAECKVLRKQIKHLEETINHQERQVRELQDSLDQEQIGFKKEFKETLLDLLR